MNGPSSDATQERQSKCRAERAFYLCTLLPNGVRGHDAYGDLAFFRIAQMPDDNVRCDGQLGKYLLRATLSHVAVLVAVFDFGGDPAADFVRMRMEPPFG